MMTHCQYHIFTEAVWFVWSKTPISGYVTDAGRTHKRQQRTAKDNKEGKMELLSQCSAMKWMLEAEFLKLVKSLELAPHTVYMDTERWLTREKETITLIITIYHVYF